MPRWMTQFAGVPEVQHLTTEEAKRLHHEQWFEGKHKGQPANHYHFPFISSDLSAGFVQVCIPEGVIDAVATSEERVERYIQVLKAQRTMGPSWGRFMRRNHRRSGGARVFLADGNHRALAAIALGRKCVEVIMPATDYREWLAAT